MRRASVGKLGMTVVLTVLIWIWADLSLEDTVSLSNMVEVSIGNMADPAVCAGLVQPSGELGTSLLLEELILKGPTSRIQRIRPELEEGTPPIKVFLGDQIMAADMTGDQTIGLLELLRRQPRIRQLGLTVHDCRPRTVVARVQRLVSRPLRVVCLDPNNMTVDGATVEPDRVQMFVPSDWTADRLVAVVTLTAEQVFQVRSEPLSKNPSVTLPNGQRRFSSQQVLVRPVLPADRLRSYTITNVRVGILMSQTLLDRYRLEIKNPQDLYSHIEIRATEEARLAFEDERITRYQVILQVDTETAEVQEKELIINLPQRYVRTNQIEAARPPARIQFNLVPRGLSEQAGGP